MSGDRPKAKVYWALVGDPPWDCHWCKGPVTSIGQKTWDGNVHHLDGDAWNNVKENLVVGHTICHQQQHAPNAEMRARISAKLKGRVSPTKGMKFSAEVNAKKSMPGEQNPFFGKKHEAESLQKMRQPRRRIQCIDCGQSYAVNWITRHKIEGRCSKPSTA